MPDIFRKLNFKIQKEILVLNAPESFKPELASLDNAIVKRNIDETNEVVFSLAFVIAQDEIDSLAQVIALKTKGDAIVWFAYPKKSSKKYKSEINRDSGWDVLGDLGFEPVRQVAIDEDWSAIRFRRVEFIKNMVRDEKMALSEQGKKKTSQINTDR